jgi:hypothetical protein
MADDYQRLQDAVPGKPTPPVFRVSLDDTRLIPITLSQLWRSMRTALPRDLRLLRFLGQRVRGILYHGTHHQRLPYQNAP